MGKTESLFTEIRLTMPTPGTLSHLEFLALDPADVSDNKEFSGYLAATQATRSLGLFIKRLRTYRPIVTPYIDLDKREIVDNKLLSRFTGSIYRNPTNQQQGHITLSGEQKLYSGDEVLTYGAFIPTNFNFTHDSSRPAEAVFIRPENGCLKKSSYHEAAAPEYKENDPLVPINVIKQAASDLLRVLGFTPGAMNYATSPEPLENDRVFWHPDYLSDDPDEFLN